MTVVVVQHVAVEGPGLIGDALDRAGRDWTTVSVFDGHACPTSPDGIEGLVVMGGPMGVGDLDRFPHLAAELALIRSCLDARVPVLGVCLGAQLLACALGAGVRPGEGIELGWHDVTLAAEGRHDPVLGHLPRRFVPLHWHNEVFDLPADTSALAASERTAVQAFRAGTSAYGLLFHLEAGLEQVQAMAEAFPGDVEAAETSVHSLVDATRTEAIAGAADAVFDAWVTLLR